MSSLLLGYLWKILLSVKKWYDYYVNVHTLMDCRIGASGLLLDIERQLFHWVTGRYKQCQPQTISRPTSFWIHNWYFPIDRPGTDMFLFPFFDAEMCTKGTQPPTSLPCREPNQFPRIEPLIGGGSTNRRLLQLCCQLCCNKSLHKTNALFNLATLFHRMRERM